MKTLKALQHDLSNPLVQLQFLERSTSQLPAFGEKLADAGLYPLKARGIEILQVNVGKMCNQTCAHCHVDAGPDRKEIMTRETMRNCLSAISDSQIETVDITGGAPEMNPDFRWFVKEVSRLGKRIMVRSNLTILTVNSKYRALPEFFAEHAVTLVSSLPCYTAENTDSQRGEGVFARSVEALRMLNGVGYGHPGSGLELNLVYNPLGAFLPPAQEELEADYKRVLRDTYGILFNSLFCLANMPINRFLDSLLKEGQYDSYVQLLVENFNPCAASGVMCRNTVSVGWDGALFDCDFNQMLDLGINSGLPSHIRDFDSIALERRQIVTRQHCFGCTAGAGSSCRGEIA